MNRRRFVIATATAGVVPLAACTGPEDGEGEGEGEGEGGGPYGNVDGPARPAHP